MSYPASKPSSSSNLQLGCVQQAAEMKVINDEDVLDGVLLIVDVAEVVFLLIFVEDGQA